MAGFPSRHGRSAQTKNWRRWRKMKKRKLNYWQSSTLTAGQSCRAFWRSMGRRFTILEAIVWDFNTRKKDKDYLKKIRKRTPSFARPRFRDWLLRRGKVLRPTQVSKAKIKQTHPPPAIQPAPAIQSPQELAFLEYAKAVNADRYRVTVIKMGEDGSRKGIHLGQKGRPNQRIYDWRNYPEKCQNSWSCKSAGKISITRHYQMTKAPYPDWWCKSWKCCEGSRKTATSLPPSSKARPIISSAFWPSPNLAASLTGKSPTSLRPCSTRNTATPNYPAQSIRTAHLDLKTASRNTGIRTGNIRLSSSVTPSSRFAGRLLWKQGSWTTPKQTGGWKKKAKPVFTVVSPGNPQQAYFAHYENIRAHLTMRGFSRVDAMIALRMRANGHSPEAVLCRNPRLRPANQDWYGKSGATGQHTPSAPWITLSDMRATRICRKMQSILSYGNLIENKEKQRLEKEIRTRSSDRHILAEVGKWRILSVDYMVKPNSFLNHPIIWAG